MKSDGVDAWLKHWFKLQKGDKHPLVLKQLSDRSDNTSSTNIVALKAKAKKQKYQHIELNNSSNGELEDKADDGGKGDDKSTIANSTDEQGEEEGVNVVAHLPSPYSASENQKTWCISLSCYLPTITLINWCSSFMLQRWVKPHGCLH